MNMRTKLSRYHTTQLLHTILHESAMLTDDTTIDTEVTGTRPSMHGYTIEANNHKRSDVEEILYDKLLRRLSKKRRIVQYKEQDALKLTNIGSTSDSNSNNNNSNHIGKLPSQKIRNDSNPAEDVNTNDDDGLDDDDDSNSDDNNVDDDNVAEYTPLNFLF